MPIIRHPCMQNLKGISFKARIEVKKRNSAKFQGKHISLSKNAYKIRLEICTGFVAVSNETATATLWPLVIATVAVRTAVGHLLNGHNAVGAVVCTVFYAVFPY